MRMTKQKLTEHTIAVWQDRTQRHLSNEDAREISENITGFFNILTEWSHQLEREVVDSKTSGGIDA